MGWADIPAGWLASDSAFDEDLVDGLDDNTTYNHECAIRSGTHTTGVRTCMSRGRESFTPTSINTIAVPIDFTAPAEDDPNFGAEPIVCIALEENTSGDDWLGGLVMCYIEDGTLTTSGCTVRINWVAAAQDFWGWVHWIAIGDVTSGE